MVEETLPARVEFDGLPPAHQEIAVRLRQGVEIEPGYQCSVGDRLKMYVPVGRSPLQLDHDQAPGGV
ncbi:hypothetical protein AB4212_09755 [Streptomyces sp. 2MCAF27]